METIKQKIEGQSTNDTEVVEVLAVQIVTEEEYIELCLQLQLDAWNF